MLCAKLRGGPRLPSLVHPLPEFTMNVLEQLHQDHINLCKLLRILDDLIHRVDEGEPPDFPLMAEIADYIEVYDKRHHHPREDRVYAFFAGRSMQLDKVMDRCRSEHAELETSGRSLAEILDGPMHDAVMPVDELAARLRQFILAELSHLDFEEGEVYPKLAALSSATDWAELDQLLPPENDPLFGQTETDRFIRLSNRIATGR